MRISAADTRTNRLAIPPFVLKRADQFVAGQALGPDGQPLLGATILLQGPGQQTRTTTSDSQGRFVFNDVCAGEVSFLANYMLTSPGLIPAQAGDTNVVIRLRPLR
jgi:hypothetical protein